MPDNGRNIVSPKCRLRLTEVPFNCGIVGGVQIEIFQHSKLCQLEMQTEDLGVSGISISRKIRERFHEEMTHISIIVCPLISGEILCGKKLNVHERSTAQQVMFNVMGNFSPFRIIEGFHSSIKHIHINWNVLFDQQLDHFIIGCNVEEIGQ